DGPCSFNPIATSVTGYGVQTSDSSAVPISSKVSAMPITKLTWRLARRVKVRAAAVMLSRRDLGPRIERGVNDIDDQIDRQHQSGQQDHHVLDDDQIVVVDRLVDELAHARQVEHA